MNYIPVEKLRGKFQVNETSFIPPFKARGHQHSSVVYNQKLPLEDTGAPPIMNDAIQRPMALATKPCKEEPFSTRKIFRTNSTSSMSGLYPATGVFRNEKKGLAYDPNKPNNLPLTPKPNTFYAGMNSTIAPVR